MQLQFGNLNVYLSVAYLIKLQIEFSNFFVLLIDVYDNQAKIEWMETKTHEVRFNNHGEHCVWAENIA